MTRASTRTNFHSARLIRVLTDLSLLDTPAQGTAFAEKLGMWVSFTDAITLSCVHSGSAASSPETPVGAALGARIDLGQAFVRVQAGLASSFGRAQRALAEPEPDALADPASAFEPYRRFYLAQQREIELKLRPLRAQVREVLGQSSPKLRKLAALDAALDGILCERESKLLLKLPSLLEKRFKQLIKAHQQTPRPAQQADNPALWMQSGGWLANFFQEMQTVLHADMDVRMQPVLGLIEAYQLDSPTKHHKINE